MKSVNDCTVYDFQREGSVNDRESSLEPSPVIKDSEISPASSCCMLECEELVSKNNYILNVSGCFSEPDSKLACSLSNHQTVIYSLANDRLKKVKEFTAHESSITNTRFRRDKNSHLFTSSLDGTVKLWDLRNHCQLGQTFSGIDSTRPITCFDVSCDDRFVCAGTEVIGGSAFLLFWDIRSTKLLGGYWESHVEDLTQVEFHPEKKSCMITGGMDGLINVFDIKKECEDDALIDSLNTELSVEKLGWLHDADSLYCLTHSGDLQLWKLTDSSPSVKFNKQQIATALSIKYSDNLYNVNLHENDDGNQFLLSGSNFGNGNCLRMISVSKTLTLPRSLIGNKQVVRSSIYDKKNAVLVTVGEKGIINIWKVDKNPSNQFLNSKLKGNLQKSKLQRMKPY